MKKAKPSKGSARTRKFASGGDIAALAGLGTLAYLLSRKKDKEKEASSKSDIVPLKEEPKASIQDEDERFKGASSGESKAPPEPEQSKVYKAEPGTGTAKPAKPVASTTKKVLSAAKAVASEPKASQTFPTSTTGKSNEERPSKPYPAAAAAAKKAEMSKGMGPKNTFLTKERLDKSKDAMRRYREEELKKKRGINEIKYDEMGNPMKKGGAVKKYAKGGSVGSASKRADGIAQRGKTRGKVY